MKKSLILAGMSIFACLLCACSSNSKSIMPENVTSQTKTTPINSAMLQNTVQGYSLEDLGLKVNVPTDVDFGDKNSRKNSGTPYEITWGGKRGEQSGIMEGGGYTGTELEGLFTYVCAQTAQNKLDVGYVPVQFLQGFYIKDLSNQQSVVKVKDKEYFYMELKPYIVYENADVIVCDFTPLLLLESFDDYLKQFSETAYYKDYDFSWVNNAYQYFHDNISKLIGKA